MAHTTRHIRIRYYAPDMVDREVKDTPTWTDKHYGRDPIYGQIVHWKNRRMRRDKGYRTDWDNYVMPVRNTEHRDHHY